MWTQAWPIFVIRGCSHFMWAARRRGFVLLPLHHSLPPLARVLMLESGKYKYSRALWWGDLIWVMLYGSSYFTTTSGLRSEIWTRDPSSQIAQRFSLFMTHCLTQRGGSEMDNCCSFANWHLFRLQNVFVTICWLARMIIHKYQCSTINRWDDDCMEERTCCFEMAMADYWSGMAIGRWQLFGDRRNHFLRSRWQTARSPSAPSELWL